MVDEWQLSSCASLPLTFFFFLVFMLFFQRHYQVTDVFLTERQLREHVGSSGIELSEPNQIYGWLEETFFPFMWAANPQASMSAKRHQSSMNHELIGGVMLTIDSELPGYVFENVSLRRLASSAGEFAIGDIHQSGGIESGPRGDGGELESAKVKACAPEVADEESLPPGAAEHPLRRVRHAAPSRSHGRGRRHQHLLADSRVTLPPLPPGWQKTGSRGKGAAIRDPSLILLSADGVRRPGRSVGVGQSRYRHSEPLQLAKSRKRTIARSGFESNHAAADRRLRGSRRNVEHNVANRTRSELFIPVDLNVTHVLGQVNQMRRSSIIKGETLALSTQTLVLNKHFQKDLLSQLDITFFLNRGGGVFADVQIVTLVLWSAGNEIVYVLLGPCWIVCHIAICFMLIRSAHTAWRQSRLMKHILRFWTLLDWGITCIGWVIVVFWLMERSAFWNVKDALIAFEEARAQSGSTEFSSTEMAKFKHVTSLSRTACMITTNTQSAVADYHVLLVLRFFLVIRGQPRLAIVLNTIRKASMDLFHLLVVILIIFAAYAVSGHVLFGRRMEEFSTFEGAFAVCFQIVMERQYNWERITDEDLYTATTWLLSFVLLLVLVFVNIFLAMLFDSYGEVRSSVDDTETLWRTTKLFGFLTKRMLGLQRRDEKWFKPRELVSAVRAVNCKAMTPTMLKEACPGIANKQVAGLFALATSRQETQFTRSSLAALPEMLASNLLSIERLYTRLEAIDIGDNYAVDAKKQKLVAGWTISSADTPTASPTTSDPCVFVGPETIPSDLVVPAAAPDWVQTKLVPHLHRQLETAELVRETLHVVDARPGGLEEASQLQSGFIAPSSARRTSSPEADDSPEACGRNQIRSGRGAFLVTSVERELGIGLASCTTRQTQPNEGLLLQAENEAETTDGYNGLGEAECSAAKCSGRLLVCA
eukprot:TRINITY_DN22253_c0_g2_i1.p1 TRINITY_DN22253_c0_g2~~TRINITY_DN22253_c0_g2_i1.p1  ORF type:complete len:1018 (+),score=116.90 TRINITY_DN22253_c0_g2_i1:254-3055(+)